MAVIITNARTISIPDGSGTAVQLVDCYGLSTESKPAEDGFANGSTFIEVDTGDLFIQKQPGTWVKVE